MDKKGLIFGASLMLIAVVLGAFGAHALKKVMTPENLESFKTGIRLQVYHALGILIFSLPFFANLQSRNAILNLMELGVILFSGSIYLLHVGKITDAPALTKVMGPVTPIGGTLLIAAWAWLIVSLVKMKA